MTNAKRGRGSRQWVSLGAAAALGFALSGCGGGSGGSAAADAQSTSAGTGTVASTGTSAGTGTSASTGTSAGTGISAGSGTSASSGTSTGSTSSGSTDSTPPTAHADSVTINWVPPTENTNGTPLTNLAGYNIHYGTSSGSLTKTLSISNPGIATYVVSDLSPGKYYFAVAAVNSAGAESALSAQVSATVN